MSVQVLRRWGRMCWLLVAPKMLECLLQCCCTQIATMNALEVSLCVCVAGDSAPYQYWIVYLSLCCAILASIKYVRCKMKDFFFLRMWPITQDFTFPAEQHNLPEEIKQQKKPDCVRKGWTGRDLALRSVSRRISCPYKALGRRERIFGETFCWWN